jgi:hypothetical protein
MHKIEETPYGYRLVFDGLLHREDAGALLNAMRTTIRPRGCSYALMVDLRNSRAFPAEAQEILKQAILHCKQTGMERNACILDSAIATLQAKRLAREAGVDESSRYIDAASDPDWERIAIDWLVRAIEPDVN